MIPTSNSTLVEQESGNTNVKSLYDKNAVANLVIGEYLDCWTWMKSIPLTKIELIDNNIFSWKIILYLQS